MRGPLLLFLCLWLSNFSSQLSAQSLQVLTADESPLIGVVLWSTDYQFRGITDQQGRIDIDTWNEIGVLNFRFLGYETLQLSHREIEELDYSVYLLPKAYQTEELVIYGRQSFDKDDLPTQITTISNREIRSTNPQTAADALSQHGDVYVQKSQMGGGSPVIRGFEANRVLLVVDGVRLNNAIYRNGHLQNAITVDPAIIDRMDVIFGPNSLMYGSDALGGVVHFQTRNAEFSTDQEKITKINYYIRHNTANQEKSAHIDFNMGSQEIASLTSVTYADYGDLRSGNTRPDHYPEFGKRLVYQYRDRSTNTDVARINENPNVQIGTAYSQIDILQKLSWMIGEYSDLDLNIQYSTSSDVPRYDNLSESRGGTLRFAEWSYGPQNRFLSSLLYNNFRSTRLYDRIKAIASFQRIDEDRMSRQWRDNQRERQEEDVYVSSLTIDFSKDISNTGLRLDYGLDIQHNEVQSNATGEHILSGILIDPVLSRYGSGDNQLTNSGAYLYLNSIGRSLDWSIGLRYSRTDYFISYDDRDPVDWPDFLIAGVDGSNDALSFSSSAKFKVSSSISINAIASTAFRSPNIDDLSKIRINGDEISFPNLDLEPERSLNVELGISGQFSEGLSLETYGYLSQFTDAIVRQNFLTPDGMSTYVNRGETLQVVANQNVGEALIYGFTSKLKYTPVASIAAHASINWIRGKEIIANGQDIPFSHIPPSYGQLSLAYDEGPLNARIVYRFNGFKPIERYGGSVDNPEYATAEGALAWSTVNIYGSYNLTNQITCSIGVENIFDIHYRPFASGVSAAGRGLTLALRGSF